MTAQQIITPAQFAKLQRQREEEKAKGEKPTLDDRVFEQHEFSAVLQLPYREIHPLSDFELLAIIGDGGFSNVFKAEGPDNVERAIKEFNLAIGVENLEIYNRNRKLFHRELKLYKNISHPQIPKFHCVAAKMSRNSGRIRDFHPALVLEYISGETLAERLGESNPEEFRDLFLQALNPLHEVHHGNIKSRFHRDIKPKNLKLNEEGTLYLLDFGTVRDTLISTQFGASVDVGTFGYAHVKQFAGDPSFRTELYSLGRTFYALATGEEPRHNTPISEGKLKRTNLDPQMKDVIALLCDESLKGPKDIPRLRKYLDREPVEVQGKVQDNLEKAAGGSGLMLLGPPPLPEGTETIYSHGEGAEEKAVPRAGRIAEFYEGMSEKDISSVKRAFMISTLTRFEEFTNWFDISGREIDSYLRESELTDNPYDITNPRHVEHSRIRPGFEEMLTPEAIRLLDKIRQRGLTPENIETRNKHEKRLKEQFEKGLKALKKHYEQNGEGKNFHHEIQRTQELLEYLTTDKPIAFPTEPDSKENFLFDVIIRESEPGKLSTTVLHDSERVAYSKLPLTSRTIKFLREQTEEHLSDIRSKDGSIDDVAETLTNKAVPRAGRIAEFYDGLNPDKVERIKRALGTLNPVNEDQIENPYNITKSQILNLVRMKESMGWFDQGDVDEHFFVGNHLEERGLTEENIKTRNKYEKKLCKQFGEGFRSLIKQRIDDPDKLNSRLEEVKNFIEYLGTFRPFALPENNDKQADFLRRAVENSSYDIFEFATILMPEEKDMQVYLPLTTDTVNFLHEQSESYLTHLEGVRDGTLDDVVDKVSLKKHNELRKKIINANELSGATTYYSIATLTAAAMLNLGPLITSTQSKELIFIGGLIHAVSGVLVFTNYGLKRRAKKLEAQLEKTKQLPAPENTLNDITEISNIIPDFYDNLSSEEIDEIKEILKNHALSKEVRRNPYDLTNSEIITEIIENEDDAKMSTDSKIRLGKCRKHLLKRGMTIKNIKEREKHEELLRKQFKRGLEGQLKHYENEADQTQIDYEIRSANLFLEYLNLDSLVMFQAEDQTSITDDIGSFLKRITLEGKSKLQRRTAFELTEVQRETYSKIPLTTKTVYSLRKHTENYLEHLQELKSNTLDDVIEGKQTERTFIPPFGVYWDRLIHISTARTEYLCWIETLEHNIKNDCGLSEEKFDEDIERIESSRKESGYKKRHRNYNKLRDSNRKVRRKYLEKSLEEQLNLTKGPSHKTIEEYNKLSQLEGMEDINPEIYTERWKLRRKIEEVKTKSTPSGGDFYPYRPLNGREKLDIYSALLEEIKSLDEETKSNIKTAFYAAEAGHAKQTQEHFSKSKKDLKAYPEIKEMIEDVLGKEIPARNIKNIAKDGIDYVISGIKDIASSISDDFGGDYE